MGEQGCDYAWERPDPKALYAAGYRFTCRYLSRDTTGKNLTQAEAAALHAAGLSIVLNWEYFADAALSGYAQGRADAQDAVAQRGQVGAPANTPIYFSVDFNATSDQIKGPVADYFLGVRSVLPLQQVGVYGGYAVVVAMLSNGLARYGWQTFAWSAGQWSNAQLRQVANGVPFQGVSIDDDVSTVDSFGQWMPDGTVREDTVAGEGYPTLADAEAVMWRLDALVQGSNTVQGGPTAGEPVWIVQHVKAVEAALAALAARPAGTATVVGGQISLSGSMSGVLTPQPPA